MVVKLLVDWKMPEREKTFAKDQVLIVTAELGEKLIASGEAKDISGSKEAISAFSQLAGKGSVSKSTKNK